MEAVGVLLGVLPLLISAIEHFDDVVRPILRYRKYTSKAQKFHDELEMERTIFRTECSLLLAAVVDHDAATKMLNNASHHYWSDPSVAVKFERQLGSLGTACNSVVSRIDTTLKAMTSVSARFMDVVSQSNGRAVGSKEWRSYIGTKLKFSFSDSGLRQSLKNLRNLNKTFLTISNQIVRLDQYSSSHTTRSPSNHADLECELQKIQLIRKASQLLYEALSYSCATHYEHQAHFCLQTTFASHSDGSTSSRIRFHLALRPVVGDSSSTDSLNMEPICDTLWFEVNSLIGSANVDATVRVQETTIDKNLSLLTLASTNSGGQNESSLIPNNSKRPEEILVDLYKRRELCKLLQPNAMPCTTSVCVGVIHQNETCKHLFYRSATPHTLKAQKRRSSLAQLVVQPSQREPSGEMPQYQRLQLAKSLALAVLQFHATPWLSDTWKSDRVLFFEDTKSQPGKRSLPNLPHIDVHISPNDQALGSSNKTRSPASRTSIIPNDLLFGLAVMLLELAYGAPFEKLKHFEDFETSPVTEVSEYNAARRLADSVGTSLGAGYAAIVKKCLRCDFGCGEDLDDPALQARLLEDVIGKLESLENGFKKLQLGP